MFSFRTLHLLMVLLLSFAVAPMIGCPGEPDDDDDDAGDDDTGDDDTGDDDTGDDDTGDDDTGDDDTGDDDTGDDDTGDDDTGPVDSDGDGYDETLDCNDNDPQTYPGAPELCDGVDNDCDTVIPADEIDDDADGASECQGDCDDTNPALNLDDADSDGWDTCEGDCDDTDPALNLDDADTDGWDTCEGDCDDTDPALNLDDADNDGQDTCGGDCDDTEDTVYTGATELCDGLDNDCDGLVPADEADVDGDGYRLCDADCDDTNATVYPGAPELCDKLDNDCDTLIDEDVGSDLDGDTYTPCQGDCNDNDDTVYPGAPELCDGIDNDCDGNTPADEVDADGDGHRICDNDCDDTDSDTYDGATELCDGIDNDCDGFVPADEADADLDGMMICDGDCDDTNDTVYDGATELCDGLDNDCDGAPLGDEVDNDGDGDMVCEGDCDDGNPDLNANDADGDTYDTCNGDCDDDDAAINPGATEIDGNWIDENCDGYASAPPWVSILTDLDPVGDVGGAVVDIEDYQYRFDGQTLELRVTAHNNYSENNGNLAVHMYVATDEVAYILAYDNANPDPGSLQLWSSLDGFTAPITNPPSLFMDTDTVSSTVLGIDLLDLGLQNEVVLFGLAATGWDGMNYGDFAPDNVDFEQFCIAPLPWMAPYELDVDDSNTGNGDGLWEPGETIEVTVDLFNFCIQPSGPNVQGVLTPNPSSTATVAMVTDTSGYHAGAIVDPGVVALADNVYSFTIDAGAVPGQTLYGDLQVTDDDGNVWDHLIGLLIVDYPAQISSTQVFSDPDDFVELFDIAGLWYETNGQDVTLELQSWDTHNADQEVDLWLDLDMDGSRDLLLSSIDSVNGDFTGGVYELDGVNWVQTGDPDAFVFDNDIASWTMDLASLGYPNYAYTFGVAWNQAGDDVDLAPDTMDEVYDLGLLNFVITPFIRPDGHVFAEVSGDGDGNIDPGEEWSIDFDIRNEGLGDSSVTVGTLMSFDTEVTVPNDTVYFGAVPAGGSASGGSVATFVVDAMAPESGFYWLDLVVDADGYIFDLWVLVHIGLKPGDTTGDAPTLDLTVPGTMDLYGDTTDLADDYQDPSACTGYGAGSHDAVYALNLTSGQQVTADLYYETGGPDAVIYVSTDAAAPDVNCLSGADNNMDETESLTFTAATTGIHYLVVDGYYLDDGGLFLLELTY